MKKLFAAVTAVTIAVGLSLAAFVAPASAESTPAPTPAASSTPAPTSTPSSAPTAAPSPTPTSTPTSTPAPTTAPDSTTPTSTTPGSATPSDLKTQALASALSTDSFSAADTAVNDPYITVVWSMPAGTALPTHATYPQQLISETYESTITLDVPLPTPTTCGTQYQVDAYVVSPELLTLLTGKVLNGPNDGEQDGSFLAYPAAGQSGANPPYKLVVNATCQCLPDTNVSYTYSADDNNDGVITVTNPDVAKYSDTLCTSFYVTATSWTYDNSSSVWPQTVDVVDHTNNTPSGALNVAISQTGTYPFAAKVTCGQGDIYASTVQSDSTLYPENDNPPTGPGILNGSHDPLDEHFLSEFVGNGVGALGFTGPSPTYVQDRNTCAQTPGDPTHTDASCVNGVSQTGSISTDGNADLTYTLFDSTNHNLGTFASLPSTPTISGLAPGTYYVHVVANSPFELANGVPLSFPFKVVIASVNCTVTPVVTTVAPECRANIQDTGFTAVDTETEGTISVPDETPNATFTVSKNGGAATPISGNGNPEPDGSYVVVATITSTGIADGFTFASSPNYVRSQSNQVATFPTITFSSTCGLPTLATWDVDVTASDATCTATSSTDGVLDLLHDANQANKVNYTVVNNATNATVYSGTNTVDGDTLVSVGPGTYTVTASDITPTDGLSSPPGSGTIVGKDIVWTKTIARVGTNCDGGNLAFTGGTIAWFGFVLAGGMLFLGIAFLLIRRRGNRTAE